MVSCFVTHGVFPKESWRRFLGQDSGPPLFEKVWITDLPLLACLLTYLLTNYYSSTSLLTAALREGVDHGLLPSLP